LYLVSEPPLKYFVDRIDVLQLVGFCHLYSPPPDEAADQLVDEANKELMGVSLFFSPRDCGRTEVN